MKAIKFSVLIFSLMISVCSQAQSIENLINTVNLDSLELTLNEFTGEIATAVNGNSVTILNRQQANNDIAADYLVERLESMPNLTVEVQNFNTNGKNVIATQLGETNPDDIYMVCGHYDSFTTYAADDNATGVAAVMEMARVLSKQCTENTIIYAFWDEEEIGLLGSQFYANLAAANGDNILGLLNMDMMGFDGDSPGTAGDNDFDIDYRNIANSVAMKDDLLDVFNAYNFDLNVVEVNPGTAASDHGSFWAQGYSAILVGESWETNDQSPFYHTPQDRVSTLDLPYFHEMTKLITGWLVTKADLLPIDSTITQNDEILVANQDNASYQWINLTTNTPISGETSQDFMATENGTYAVQITLNGCTEISQPITVDTLHLEHFASEDIRMYPNPSENFVMVDSNMTNDIALSIFDAFGRLQQETIVNGQTKLDIKMFSEGIYFFKFNSEGKTAILKFVKD